MMRQSMCCVSDFNECSVANECDKLYGTCIDVYPTSGKLGYRCECKNGYVGDGFICTGTEILLCYMLRLPLYLCDILK